MSGDACALREAHDAVKGAVLPEGPRQLAPGGRPALRLPLVLPFGAVRGRRLPACLPRSLLLPDALEGLWRHEPRPLRLPRRRRQLVEGGSALRRLVPERQLVGSVGVHQLGRLPQLLAQRGGAALQFPAALPKAVQAQHPELAPHTATGRGGLRGRAELAERQVPVRRGAVGADQQQQAAPGAAQAGAVILRGGGAAHAGPDDAPLLVGIVAAVMPAAAHRQPLVKHKVLPMEKAVLGEGLQVALDAA
mmetsp:Transcript_34275/g.86330  ORF Transcript_34275/g.86330 Transcript_34275/m.86330 type:complete len:249 (-) Transcript_34275:822-1568(-)